MNKMRFKPVLLLLLTMVFSLGLHILDVGSDVSFFTLDSYATEKHESIGNDLSPSNLVSEVDVESEEAEAMDAVADRPSFAFVVLKQPVKNSIRLNSKRTAQSIFNIPII